MVVYRYAGESRCSMSDGGAVVSLATSGGDGEHPRFFDGVLAPPRAAARAVMTVARLARSRFELGMPSRARAALARDPVVTAGEGVLRFESFSACGGVYARADLTGGGVSAGMLGSGTTNVDVNEPLRRALALVTDRTPLRMEVGSDDLAVTAAGVRTVERKVPLPDRWLRGLGEVQLAASQMVPRAELGAVAARRFLQALPGPSGAQLWLVPSGTGLRLSHRGDGDAIPFTGPHRLRLAADLVDLVRGVRVYAPPPTMRAGVGSAAATPVVTATAWELLLDGVHLWLVLSPAVERGFSGDGGVLYGLALRLPGAIDAAAGRVGFDLATGRWFDRPLPFARTAVEQMHPRLIDARQLFEGGAVELQSSTSVLVRSEQSTHRVNLAGPAPTCTCPWYAKHRGERGPCKHVLAAVMAAPVEGRVVGVESL